MLWIFQQDNMEDIPPKAASEPLMVNCIHKVLSASKFFIWRIQWEVTRRRQAKRDVRAARFAHPSNSGSQYVNHGIWNRKAKSGRDSGMKVSAKGGMPKITLGITGLHETLGRDYGIWEHYYGPSQMERLLHKTICKKWTWYCFLIIH